MKALRPLQTLSRVRPLSATLPPHHRRTFLPNPFAASSTPTPQTLTATRTLPYPSPSIYKIIADVSSYSSFLPYCRQSRITRWSSPDSTTSTRWPSEAELVVGWGQITETFRSRVFCVPGSVVEAIAGRSETGLERESVAHHLSEGEESGERGVRFVEGGEAEQLLTHLSTRWTVTPVGEGGGGRTKVDLRIEFAFANPLYMTLSAGAAPKVADMMIKAFEERVRDVLGKGEGELVGDGGKEVGRLGR